MFLTKMFAALCSFFLFFFLNVQNVACVASGTRADFVRTCEPIKIALCKGLGYNNTGMPNLVGHELQQDAELQFQTFTPLVQYGCSSQLKFFLCSVYVPMCTEKVPETIGPCRPLCESVKSKTEARSARVRLSVAASSTVQSFKENKNEHSMCMEGPKEQQDHWHSSSSNVDKTWPVTRKPAFKTTRKPSRFNSKGSKTPNRNQNQHNNRAGMAISGHSSRNHFGMCLQHKFADEYFFINRTSKCAHQCEANILYMGLALCSLVSLVWRHPLADLAAAEIGPVGAGFTAMCLISGSLWGKPMWGAWWVWDARLTSVLVLFFLYPRPHSPGQGIR